MKEVYVDPDFTRVGFIKSLLDTISIPCFVRNEAEHNTLADLSAAIFWPAIWVVHDVDYAAAKAVIEGWLSSASIKRSGTQVCLACGESVPNGFHVCWNCQADVVAAG